MDISNACHYRRIFVQCLSLSAHICPMPVTISVYLSNACHCRRIFCTSLGKRAPCIFGSQILAECPAELNFTLCCYPVLSNAGTSALIFAPIHAPEAKLACSMPHCGVILLLNIDLGMHFIIKSNVRLITSFVSSMSKSFSFAE